MRQLAPPDFLPAVPPLLLAGDEIHVWFYPHWQASASDAADSAPLRALIAGYLDRDVADVQIQRPAPGKPRVAGESGLQFNLSHSGGALLVALSREQPLGVDLEVVPGRSRRVLELARRFFAPSEVAALEALPDGLRQEAFLQIWTGKEAVLKALGRGIAFGLDRIVFDIDVAGESFDLQRVDLQPPAAGWHIRWLRPVQAALGALAWQGPDCRIRAFTASAQPP